MKKETLLYGLLGTYAIGGAGGMLLGILAQNRISDIGFTMAITGMIAGAILLVIIGITIIKGE